jgi:sec-independent protein translocase protein TatA
MPSLGPPELILILVIVLILFGPGKLTGLGSSLGKSIKEFRKATTDPDEEEEAAELAKTAEAKVSVAEERKEIRRPTVTIAEEKATTVEATDRENKIS